MRMLTIIVPAREWWDEEKEEFVQLSKDQRLTLEHSLISLAKWERRWHKPFLSKEPKSMEETIDYIKCMTLNTCPEIVYECLTPENFKQIDEYINDSMTATIFSEETSNSSSNSQFITNELIYYWMLSLNIPHEYEKWHLNRLITLIRITSVKNQPPKKRSAQEIAMSNRALNEARKREWGTKG